MAVGLVEVVVLEGRGRGQDDVGEVHGVGREELVDHDEEVLAREALAARFSCSGATAAGFEL